MLRLNKRPFQPHFLAALLVAILSRVSLFFGTMIVPIPNEMGQPISPLTANTALDLGYYQWARNTLFHEPRTIIDNFEQIFAGGVVGGFFFPGPLFPSILELFDYGSDNTLSLAAVYLLLSVLLVVAWLYWLRRKGVGAIWLYVFALLPSPFWFMLNVSTDLLFAVIVGVFWLLWFDERVQNPRHAAGIGAILVLAVLLRPNAMSLLLFLVIDVLIWDIALAKRADNRKSSLLFVGFVLFVAAASVVYYLPYFWDVRIDAAFIGYFGVLPDDYFNGLWPSLPRLADLGLSWLSFVGAKLLYLTGIRPSFGNATPVLVILRMLPGFVVLPGLVWLFVRGSRREQIFVVIYLAPIILSVTQDRYLLPIQPILFLYGTKAWGEFFQLCLRHRKIMA